MGAQGPPLLGTDDIVRYTGPDHFLDDFRENLHLGRLFVRTKRTFSVQARLHIAIEGPGVDWSVGAEVLVLLARSGFLGLEFLSFDEEVKPTLELLVEEVAASQKRAAAPPPVANRWAMMREEKTVIGAVPAGLAESTRDDAPAIRREDTDDGGSIPPRGRPSASPEVPTLPPLKPLPDHLDDFEDDDKVRRIAKNTTPAGPRHVVTAPETSARVAKARYDSDEDSDESAETNDYDEDDEDSAEGDLVTRGQNVVMRPPLRAPIQRDGDDSGLMEVPAHVLEKSSTHPPPRDDSAFARTSEEPVVPSVAPLRMPSSAVAPPPAPAVAIDGLEAIDAHPGLRATAGGVIRVNDPTELLGFYLTSIRHGALALHGGPAGQIGQGVTLKLAGQRVVTVAAEITGRLGGWTYVSIADASEILGLLKDLAPDWRPAIDRIGGGPVQPVSVPPPPPSEPPPSRTPSSIPPPVVAVTPAVIGSPPPIVAAAVLAPAPVSLPPEPLKPITFDEPGQPQPGRLEADMIIFRGPKDLEHELKSNLKNGGLIASSSPIPIRTHKSLRVMLGSIDINVRIEADVVYAAGGRVGFAVTSFGDVASALDKVMKAGFTPSIPPPPTSGIQSVPPPSFAPPNAMGPAGASVPPASIAPPTEGPTEIFGHISRQLTQIELLELPTHRIQADADLEDAHPLMVLDLVTRKRLRGILNFKRTNESVAIYVHEGSVAFVDMKPWNEEHALGKVFMHQKKLSEAQVREALEKSKREKRPLGKTLLAMGLVNANALVQALREQTRMKVEPVFSWATGTFDFQTWADPPVRADLVLTGGQGIQVKFVRATFEHMTSSEIEELLSPSLTRVVQVTGEADPQSPLFGFQPKELRFLQAWIDGKRDLSNTVTGSPIGRLASLRLVGFGLAMNMLKFVDGKRAGGPRAGQPRRSTSGQGHAAMKRTLEEELKIMRNQNYFDVLGIHWSAHFRSYPEAYKKVRARFDVTRGELRDAPPAVHNIAKEAAALLETAYKKLMNEDERIAYRKKLFDSTEREYSADMLIKQAEVLVMRGDRMGAIEAFETAVELSPNTRNKQLLAQARER